MPADAVRTAGSLLRQGIDPVDARSRLIDLGYSGIGAGEAVVQAESQSGQPAADAPPGGGQKGTRPTSRAGRSGARGRKPASSPTSKIASKGGLDPVRGLERGFDKAAGEASRITLTPPKKVTAKDGAGFVFGMFAYVLMLMYIKHGPAGVKGWLGAKFVNKPWTPPGKRGGGDDDGDKPGTIQHLGLASTRPPKPNQPEFV